MIIASATLICCNCQRPVTEMFAADLSLQCLEEAHGADSGMLEQPAGTARSFCT